MKDISVSFTPDDLIHNMASIGHIKTTETIPPSVIDLEEKKKVNYMSLQLSTVLFKLDNSVTSSFNFRPIVFFVLVISLRSLSSIPSRCLFTDSKAVYGVKKSSKAIELLTKLKDTSVKLREILATRKDNVSRFEEETNAVLADQKFLTINQTLYFRSF
jgi:hypothetical protein